jgi:hypothetical protein
MEAEICKQGDSVRAHCLGWRELLQ